MRPIKSLILLSMVVFGLDSFAQVNSASQSVEAEKAQMLEERELKKSQILQSTSQPRELTPSERQVKLDLIQQREAKKKAFLESQSINNSSRPLTKQELEAIKESRAKRLESQ